MTIAGSSTDKSSWVGCGCLSGLMLLLLVPLALRGLGAVSSNVRGALEREGPLRRLSEGFTASQRARGMVHVGGTITTDVGRDGRPLCRVVHQHYVSGKNGGWRDDAWYSTGSGTRLRATDGAVYTVYFDAQRPSQSVAFEPDSPSVVQGASVDAYRAMFSAQGSAGRFVDDCARQGDSVFIEACAIETDTYGRTLVPCGETPVTVTWGATTPQRRVDAIANDVAASTGVFVLLAMVGLWLLWASRVEARPLARPLAAWGNTRDVPDPYVLPVSVVSVFVTVVIVMGIYRTAYGVRGSNAEVAAYGHWFMLLMSLLMVSTAIAALRRGGVVRAALRLVADTPTARLAESTQGVVELAVRAAPGSASVTTALTHARVTYLHVRVLAGVGTGKQYREILVRDERAPATFDVRDESGAGVLRTAGMETVLEPAKARVASTEYRATIEPTYKALFGGLWHNSDAHTYVVEERTIAPDETLYVYGEVQQVTAGEGADYRKARAIPHVGGTREKPLVVFHGTEGSLRSDLRRELAGTTAIAALGLVVAVPLVLFDLWLIAK